MDVDPARHAFAADSIVARVSPAIAAALAEAPRTRLDRVITVDKLLARDVGLWAVGWSWVSGDGGPVAPPYRIAGTDGWPTAPLVMAALVDWRKYLEELAALFATLAHDLASTPRELSTPRPACCP